MAGRSRGVTCSVSSLGEDARGGRFQLNQTGSWCSAPPGWLTAQTRRRRPAAWPRALPASLSASICSFEMGGERLLPPRLA